MRAAPVQEKTRGVNIIRFPRYVIKKALVIGVKETQAARIAEFAVPCNRGSALPHRGYRLSYCRRRKFLGAAWGVERRKADGRLYFAMAESGKAESGKTCRERIDDDSHTTCLLPSLGPPPLCSGQNPKRRVLKGLRNRQPDECDTKLGQRKE